MHIRNTGDEPAPFTEVEFELPLEAMFVDMTGLDGAKVDAADKVIAATVDLPAGADRQFSVRMVVPHDAGGRSLTPHLKVRYAHAGVEFYGGEPVTIDTRVANTGVVLGGVRFNPRVARRDLRPAAVSGTARADGIAQGIERAGADDRDRRGLPVDLRGDGLARLADDQRVPAIILHDSRFAPAHRNLAVFDVLAEPAQQTRPTSRCSRCAMSPMAAR